MPPEITAKAAEMPLVICKVTLAHTILLLAQKNPQLCVLGLSHELNLFELSILRQH